VEPGAGTTIYPGAVTAEPCFELVFRPCLVPGVKSPRVHLLSAGLVAGDWDGLDRPRNETTRTVADFFCADPVVATIVGRKVSSAGTY
jgi:hypothetical protein